jgi:hypothetical protein
MGDRGLGTRDWGKREENHSPVPAARITGENLTQRRKDAKGAKGKKGVFISKYSVILSRGEPSPYGLG